MRKTALLLGLAVLLVVSHAKDVQAAPSSITFTGRLSDSGGPIDGSVSLTFTVYTAAVGGSSQWSDTVALTADAGLVFAVLGTIANPMDEAVFDGAPMFLEIIVGAETLSPRLPITSTPYSIRSSGADNADMLGGTIAPADVVTDVTAGAGLTGGGAGGALSLAVDTATIQARISAAGCAAGSSIRVVDAAGAVTCEADDGISSEVDGIIGNEVNGATNTSLTRSGAGTAGSPYTLAVDTSVIQARVAAAGCAAGSSIRVIDAAGAVTCETDDGAGVETDGVIGNEITAATNTSLTRSGAGTGASPYTLAVDTSVIQARIAAAGCAAGSAIRVVDAAGAVTCQAAGIASEVDAVIGNEVTAATNTSLTRSGAGTAGSPYTLAVDTSIIQARIAAAGCGAGSSIRVVDAAGAVTCETDDTGIASEVDAVIGNEVTNATVGGGLTRSGSGTAGSPYTLGISTGATIDATFEAGYAISTNAGNIDSLWGGCPSGSGTCYRGASVATCAAGLNVIGGGCEISNVVYCYGIDNNPSGSTAWNCGAACWTQSSNTVTAYAICARIQ